MNQIKINIADSIANRFGIQSGERMISANLNDADAGIAFMISQLAYLEQTAYETPYAPIIFEQLVPINTAPQEGALSVNYFSFDGRTRADFIGAHANDLPSVGIERQMHNVPLGYAGLSMTYTLDELRTAAMVGQNLDATQATLCYRGARELQQKVVLYGDASRGMKGLINNDLVKKTNASVDWLNDATTADQIIKDVNDQITAVWLDSKQTYLPNTILLDGTRYSHLVNKRLSNYNDRSLLTYLQENNLYFNVTGKKLDIRPLAQLEGAELKSQGVNNGKARMIVYDRSPVNLNAYMPIAPRFIAPQQRGLSVVTPMEFKISGTEIRYPMAMRYVDAK